MSSADSARVVARVQAIVAEATGSPLTGSAASALEALFAASCPPSAPDAHDGSFRREEATVLFADLRGFSGMVDVYPAEVMLVALNQFLIRMTEIAHRHGGTIIKFLGDSIMVVFGTDSRRDDAHRAVSCAVEMQIAAEALNHEHKRIELPKLYLGIGINSGAVNAGRFGSDIYSDYTVIGSEVNLAARIEAFSLRGQILIGEKTFDRCRDFATTGAAMEVYVKGRADAVPIREVLGIPGTGAKVPRQDVRGSHRVKVSMPFSYQVIRNKAVLPDRLFGTILDLGYGGLRAILAQPLDRYTEVRMEIDLSVVRHMATNLYGRTISGGKTINDPVGIEFTSMHPDTDAGIRRFVQLLIQGSEVQ